MASVYAGHLSKGDGLLAAQSHKPTHPGLIQVEFNNGSYNSRLVALVPFKNGERITLMTPHLSSAGVPSYSTVQTGEESHIQLNSDLLYCNHSCEPNVRFDVTGDRAEWAAIADKEIKKGDTLTFFYPSTEWSMAQPFKCACNCGSSCLGMISGASHIPTQKLSNYFLNAHILRLKLEQVGATQQEALLNSEERKQILARGEKSLDDTK